MGMGEPFGERLKRLRTERNLSPGALALQVGVTEGAIRQMESGQTKSASFQVGVKLAAALRVDPAYLALGEPVALPTPQGASAADLAETVSRLGADLGRIADNQDKALAEFQKLRERIDTLEASAKQPRKRSA